LCISFTNQIVFEFYVNGYNYILSTERSCLFSRFDRLCVSMDNYLTAFVPWNQTSTTEIQIPFLVVEK